MKRQEGIFWHSFPSAVLSPDSCYYHCHFAAGVGILPTALARVFFLPAAQAQTLRPLHFHLHFHLQLSSFSRYFSFSVVYYLCFQSIQKDVPNLFGYVVRNLGGKSFSVK